jgi:hypothetical protein
MIGDVDAEARLGGDMGAKEEYVRLRAEANTLREAWVVKSDEVTRAKAAADAEDEASRTVELRATHQDAEQYVTLGEFLTDGTTTVWFNKSDRAAVLSVLASAIYKARADGASQQRALIRQAAEQAEDGGDFVRWVLEST